VARQAEADLRELLAIPPSYKVLFMQGGATAQFSAVPQNLAVPDATADYLNTGHWSQRTIAEAKRFVRVHVAADEAASGYSTAPAQPALSLTPGAAYVHYTPNETIHGVEFSYVPDTAGAPLVADMSSTLLSRPIDVSRFGLIYAGAQKNLGPSGVTLVIIREDLLARSQKTLPTMLNYAVHAENDSLYNTPNTFGIYILGLTMAWLRNLGGLPAIAEINKRKAGKLYAEIDRTGFYRGTAEKASRSLMNVTFRLATEELEKLFVKESTAAGLDGLKGHRSVGGMRASIYNAFPEEGIDALVSFMQEFERTRG
jgi:phosphoserine aminotransferase